MRLRETHSNGEFNLTIYHDYYEVLTLLITTKTKNGEQGTVTVSVSVQIMEHLDEVASQYDFVETEVIGQSWEGRDLKIVKICRGGCGHKPAIWIGEL